MTTKSICFAGLSKGEEAEITTQFRQANAQLGSEVQDLKEGLDMVEEKARSELGMVKPNEVFVQYSHR